VNILFTLEVGNFFINVTSISFFVNTVLRRLGDVVVSVLATGPEGLGFTPGRGDEILRALKICSTSPFGWYVKAEAPCCKILRHAKDLLTYVTY
jgi:hypothetical protein